MAVPAFKEITLSNNLLIRKKPGSLENFRYNKARCIERFVKDYVVVGKNLVSRPEITFRIAFYSDLDPEAPVFSVLGRVFVDGNTAELQRYDNESVYDSIDLSAAAIDVGKTWIRDAVNEVTDGIITAAVELIVGSSA